MLNAASFTSLDGEGVKMGVVGKNSAAFRLDCWVLESKILGRLLQELRLATIQIATRKDEKRRDIGIYRQSALVIE